MTLFKGFDKFILSDDKLLLQKKKRLKKSKQIWVKEA